MIEIVINNWTVSRVLEVVQDLRAKGLEQGTDFDFGYYPSYFDDFGGTIRQRHTVFTFYTESMATWFTIAYV